MGWPRNTDYHEAVQNPALCFSDAELRQGQPDLDALGLPRPRAGNFADVYQIQCAATGHNWAVKCFTRHVSGLQGRYHAISAHLKQADLPFTVDFTYLDEGIRIRGEWFPVVKMHWVEGFPLNEFVKDSLDRPALLTALAELWLRLARRLREAAIGHGDLQHGNILLVPGDKTNVVGLRLIDYDGMYVPALAMCPSGEVGHPHYQHPERMHERTYGPEVDRFAHLVIYTALRGLAVGGRSLWERHDNGDNLLFRRDDFEQPGISALFQELWRLEDPEARALAGHLLLAAQGPVGRVPLLEDLVQDGAVRFLMADQEEQVEDLLAWGATRVRAMPRLQPGAAVPWWASAPSGPVTNPTPPGRPAISGPIQSRGPRPGRPQGITASAFVKGLADFLEPRTAPHGHVRRALAIVVGLPVRSSPPPYGIGTRERRRATLVGGVVGALFMLLITAFLNVMLLVGALSLMSPPSPPGCSWTGLLIALVVLTTLVVSTGAAFGASKMWLDE
jgi:hypothetical protein